MGPERFIEAREIVLSLASTNDLAAPSDNDQITDPVLRQFQDAASF